MIFAARLLIKKLFFFVVLLVVRNPKKIEQKTFVSIPSEPLTPKLKF